MEALSTCIVLRARETIGARVRGGVLQGLGPISRAVRERMEGLGGGRRKIEMRREEERVRGKSSYLNVKTFTRFLVADTLLVVLSCGEKAWT